MATSLRRLISWEGLLLLILLVVVALNSTLSPVYLGVTNQVNLFQLSIEKIIVALAMAFVIINGEIDLSVASLMGLAACVVAFLFSRGVPMHLAILAALATGALCGAFNGYWVAYVNLPSLAVSRPMSRSSRTTSSSRSRSATAATSRRR